MGLSGPAAYFLSHLAAPQQAFLEALASLQQGQLQFLSQRACLPHLASLQQVQGRLQGSAGLRRRPQRRNLLPAGERGRREVAGHPPGLHHPLPALRRRPPQRRRPPRTHPPLHRPRAHRRHHRRTRTRLRRHLKPPPNARRRPPAAAHAERSPYATLAVFHPCSSPDVAPRSMYLPNAGPPRISRTHRPLTKPSKQNHSKQGKP